MQKHPNTLHNVFSLKYEYIYPFIHLFIIYETYVCRATVCVCNSDPCLILTLY